MVYCLDEVASNFEKRATTLEKAKANILVPQLRQKRTYDQRHSDPYVFRIGGLVLKKDFKRKKRRGGNWIPNGWGPTQ